MTEVLSVAYIYGCLSVVLSMLSHGSLTPASSSFQGQVHGGVATPPALQGGNLTKFTTKL